MILQVFAILDKKVNAYTTPAFMRTRGEAIRSFIDACRAESNPFAKHAEDYVFCHVGEWNDQTGELVARETPEIIFTALDAVTIDG